jgi:hypothetical protein
VNAIIDTKLAERVKAKLDDLDEKTIEAITSGNLTDWGQYQRKVGYRKAIADAKTLIVETLEDILKE